MAVPNVWSLSTQPFILGGIVCVLALQVLIAEADKNCRSTYLLNPLNGRCVGRNGHARDNAIKCCTEYNVFDHCCDDISKCNDPFTACPKRPDNCNYVNPNDFGHIEANYCPDKIILEGTDSLQAAYECCDKYFISGANQKRVRYCCVKINGKKVCPPGLYRCEPPNIL